MDLFGQPLKAKPIPEPPKPFEKPVQNPFASASSHKEEAPKQERPFFTNNPFHSNQPSQEPSQPSQPQQSAPQSPQSEQESPFVFKGRPMANPEPEEKPKESTEEKPAFGNAGTGAGGFASLNPDGQSNGLWGSTAAFTPPKETPKEEGEHLQFEHDVPAFLRKKK